MSEFKLNSEFTPKGDQPSAIEELVSGLENGSKHQVLLGITGSGKTFTMANVIKELQRPALIISHNKTLAAQLYGEFKQLFPKMPLNILLVIMIIINQKHIYQSQIHLLKKICQSMKRLIFYA